jgi:hypothetical protein
MNELIAQITNIGFVAGVIGNLTASAVLGVPALIGLHRKLDRHHREHMAAITAGKEETNDRASDGPAPLHRLRRDARR